MKIDWLKPLLEQESPFATVYIDVTGSGETTGRQVAERWRGLRRELERASTPPAILEALDDAVTGPVLRTGANGRLLVASAAGVHVDRGLRDAPEPSVAVYDTDPALLPATICADESVDYLLVTVDRRGANLVHVGTAPNDRHSGHRDAQNGASRTQIAQNRALDGQTVGGRVVETTIEGDQDDIARTQSGPSLQGRADSRAHDSWERNMTMVARELDRIVMQDPPELILVTGDVRATTLLCASVGRRAKDLIVEIAGGSRSSGVNEHAFAGNLGKALEEFRVRRRGAVIDRFRQGLGQGSGAVSSLADVIEVLRRGQVAEIVIAEGALTHEPIADRLVWTGPGPLEIAESESDLEEMGVREGRRQMSALVAVVRAALGQEAGITFVPTTWSAAGDHEQADFEVADHIGALLRWDDPKTPRESLASQSGDANRIANFH